MSNSDSSGGAALGGTPAGSSQLSSLWLLALFLLGLAAAGAIGFSLFGPRHPAATSIAEIAEPPGAPVGPHGVWKGLKAKAGSNPRSGDLLAERRAFAILRGEDESIPPQMKSHIRETIGAPQGSFAFEETQLGTSSLGALWVVSSREIACLVEAKHGSLACDPAPEFVKDGLALGVVGPPGSLKEPNYFIVFGVAPDWAKKARLRVGRTVREIPIHGNLYAARARTPILLLRLKR